MEMYSIPWSPVLRYATPLPMNRTPFSTVALQHKSVSSVLRYEDVAGGSQQSGGRIIFLPVIWTHFLPCEDVAGGSQQSGGESLFLPVIWTHFLACEDVVGGSQQLGENIFFS